MAQAGDECDIGLAGAGHVEDRKIFGGLQERAELVEAAAVAAKRREARLCAGAFSGTPFAAANFIADWREKLKEQRVSTRGRAPNARRSFRPPLELLH